ncbi:MAG: hypothetical protein L0Z54_01190 [Thermoplasmata archaeon]|nr:hypothetical protein [Thermoplasmata archaeon]
MEGARGGGPGRRRTMKRGRDPYLEDLARDPNLAGLLDHQLLVRVVRAALIWSVFAMTLALTFVLVTSI